MTIVLFRAQIPFYAEIPEFKNLFSCFFTFQCDCKATVTASGQCSMLRPISLHQLLSIGEKEPIELWEALPSEA